MPRASKADLCMFCAQMPCICNVKARKAPAKKAALPVQAVQSTPPVERKPRAHVTPPVVGAIAPAVTKQPVKQAVQRAQLSAAQVLDVQAIQALVPILHPEEQLNYMSFLNTVLTVEEKIAAWKALK